MTKKFPLAADLNQPTPQTQPIPGRESEMSRNAAGGYTFNIDDWARLRRFLIMGSEGGTYYIGQRELTRQNAAVVTRCAKADGKRTVQEIIDVSVNALAPKNDPAILALAICSKEGDRDTRALANRAVLQVCRTGTHLFQWAAYVDALGGWGRGARTAISEWYYARTPVLLAQQVVKYQQRNGWAHVDLVNLAHIKPREGFESVLSFITSREDLIPDDAPDVLKGFDMLRKATKPTEAASLIRQFRLPRECVPTELQGSPEVQEALLVDIGATALLRNLGNYTKSGLIAPLSDASKSVVSKIGDSGWIRSQRIHPMAIFLALTTYQSGRGFRGSGSWTPVQQIVDALDAAFYTSMSNVVPSGKNVLIAVDTSGSMMAQVQNTAINCAQAAGAMALVVARTEPNHIIIGIETGYRDAGVSPSMRLDAAMRAFRPGGGTDLSQGFRYLTDKGLDVDGQVLLSDNETWAGWGHPDEAHKAYRRKVGHPVKFIVAAMAGTMGSVADPTDNDTLQTVGLDASLPQVINQFLTGAI